VAHTYNPSYSGGRIRRIKIGSQLWQIVLNTLSQKYPTQLALMGPLIPIIVTIQEAEFRRI
jgi:hypothetical protein